ncbi:MAG TPA: acetate--CoA ligase family protein, partial [Pirellulales bacterium]|nr:acetate--CoA ligase family protein [Pirellulales bacterium]
MIVRSSSALAGPNVWANSPVLEVLIELAPKRNLARADLQRLVERLGQWLPELRPSLSDLSVSDSTVEIALGTLGRAIAATCLEMQKRVSAPASWTWACRPRGGRLFALAISYEEESVARSAFSTACDVCLAALDDRAIDIERLIGTLRDVADRVCLGPSTRAIVRAAQARGIPVRRLNNGSFVQLGHGVEQRRVRTAETDRTGAVAEEIASDKELTKRMLGAIGVPVPEGRLATDPADAWSAAEEIGVPVVVKPRDGNHGRGVFTALMTREQVEAAFVHASEEGDGVLVERFALGAEHRLLVVDG